MKVNVFRTDIVINCFKEHLDEVLTLDKCLELNSSKKKHKYFEDQVEFLFPDGMNFLDYKMLESVFWRKFEQKKKGGELNEV